MGGTSIFSEELNIGDHKDVNRHKSKIFILSYNGRFYRDYISQLIWLAIGKNKLSNQDARDNFYRYFF